MGKQPKAKYKQKPPLSDLDRMYLTCWPHAYTPAMRKRLRPLWEAYREELMRSINLGTRPQGFWQLEVDEEDRPGEPPDPRDPNSPEEESDLSRLIRLKLATAEERELWRQDQQRTAPRYTGPA